MRHKVFFIFVVGFSFFWSTAQNMPIGYLDYADSYNASGWAVDLDAGGGWLPVDVHVYIDGRFYAVITANQSRPDLVAAGVAPNAEHGYSFTISGYDPTRAHEVVVYAINYGGGNNPPLLNCPKIIGIQPSGNSIISNQAGNSNITITTTQRLAGAIHSLTWGGKEFINSYDHGRQLQSANSFNQWGECYNPTEAGSNQDGTGNTSTSFLQYLNASANHLETQSLPAYWTQPGYTAPICGIALNTTPRSTVYFRKKVTIGMPGMAHIIKYDTELELPPGESYSTATIEILTGYMPPEFSIFRTYDPASQQLASLSDGPGEQGVPIIFSTPDNNYAMGIYNPDLPDSMWPVNGYGRWRFGDCTKWNTVARENNVAGTKKYRSYVIVGSLTDVMVSMTQLYNYFKITANFSANIACVGNPTTFTDLTVGANAETVYQWDFNNDGIVDGTTTGNCTYTFPNAGAYPVKLTTINGSDANHKSSVIVNVIVYAPPSLGTISGTSLVCQGQNSVIYSVPANPNANSYIWALPSGATGFSTTNSIVVNYGSSAVSGNVSVKGNNSCGNGADSVFAITVNPATVGGSVSGGTLINAGSTSGLLTLSGNVGNIVRWESAVSPFAVWTTIGNTNNTFTSAVLNQTTQFRAVVKSGTCNEVASIATTVTVGSTTWNGTSWSNGIPSSITAAIISGNYAESANLAASSLTVNNNAVATVNSGFNVNISGDVTVTPGSSLIFENNTNLVQTKNTNNNSGNIRIRRNTSPLMLLDYVLWSSPVAGQLLQSFSPLTLSNRFYAYNPSTNFYNVVVSPSTTNFANGTGYLIRMPNNYSTTPTIWTGQFEGVPNNGNYDISVANNAYNAIGNPYPSTINADTFRSVNGITEALYFWRKTNNPIASSYATYTLAGATANTGGLSAIVPNGIIQVGQGFIAKTTSANISFTNAMRLVNNGNQFLKTKQIELNRVWLNLSNDTSPVNQMMVAYMTDATSGVDDAIDGRYINDSPTALNSLVNNEEFVIQGRALPFTDTDVVPLAFKTVTGGNFTIAIDHVDGLFSNGQNVFIKDNLTGTVQDVKQGAYAFSSAVGTFNSRFELVYKSGSALGIEESTIDANTVIVYNQKGILTINAGKTIMKTVRVFDVRGRLILEQKNINSSSTDLKELKAEQQALILQITSDEHKKVVKKVVY